MGGAAGLCGTGLLCLALLLPTQKLGNLGVKTDVWDQAWSYQTGGCLATFLRNTEFLEVEEPEDTSVERLQQIVSLVEQPGAGRGFGGPAQHCGHYERVLGRL